MASDARVAACTGEKAMSATIIYLHKYREPTRIPPAVQQGYSDEFVSHARNIEVMFEAMARAMCGERPADTEQETA